MRFGGLKNGALKGTTKPPPIRMFRLMPLLPSHPRYPPVPTLSVAVIPVLRPGLAADYPLSASAFARCRHALRRPADQKRFRADSRPKGQCSMMACRLPSFMWLTNSPRSSRCPLACAGRGVRHGQRSRRRGSGHHTLVVVRLWSREDWRR